MKKTGLRMTILITAIILLTFTEISAVDVEKDIIEKSQALIGTPYVYGGVSPEGFDCSGFVYYLFKRLEDNWPRATREQGRQGAAVNKNALQPGDLTFWATGSDPRRISHVSIYIGNDSMIHALSDGPRRGIAISSMSSRYWTPKYLFSRRIFSSSGGSSGGSGTGVSTGRQQTRKQEQEIVERIFPRGKYVGQIFNGAPHGTGTYYLNNGDVYEGEFKNGVYHGEGKYTIPYGTVWTGTFISGRLHGEGTRTWPTGSRYEGTYSDGKESGGWFTAYDGKVLWALRNSRGQWEMYEKTQVSRQLTDTDPPADQAEDARIDYLFGDNPWDEWEGVIDFPDDWETGPMFEEAYLREQMEFQNYRSSEQDAFKKYKSGN